jgi:hypothetical protein
VRKETKEEVEEGKESRPQREGKVMSTTTRVTTQPSRVAGFKHALFLVPALVLVVFAFSAAPALASSPALTVNTVSLPTNLPPGGEGEVLLQITNLGDAPANGETSPIVIAEKLPAGLVATAISGAECDPETLHCAYKGILQPYTELRIKITVNVETSASTAPGGLVNEAVLSGGGAAPTTTRHALTVSPTPAPFGVEDLRLLPTNEDGSIDTQAGSHPFQLTATTALNTLPGSQPVALPKDLHFSLPAGLVGNPQVLPQCTSQEFDTVFRSDISGCPAETAIGVANVRFRSGQFGTLPLFNLVPAVGEPARFGFSIVHVPVILDTAVRTGGDYGVVVSVNNISQIEGFLGSQVTFWGVPADPSHDNVRGWGCLFKTVLHGFEPEPCVAPVGPRLIPFLTLPTSCSGPAGMLTTVEADSWSEPGVFTKRESLLEEIPGEPLGLVGCNRLPFEPSISVAPDGQAGSTPTGLTVGQHVSQASTLDPEGLGESDVKGVTVTLPEGVVINPAGADGLEACSEGQVGFEPEHGVGGFEEFVSGVKTPLFTPTLPEPLSPGLNLAALGFCPNAAKIGTVRIKTPLLPNPVDGSVYLASQNANPFGSLVAMYIVAEDPVSGVLVKVPGKVSLSESGRITATFEDIPQAPFEELELHFFGGERAPLATPAHCGRHTTDVAFTPWSGGAPVNTESTFEILSGPDHTACPGAALPFAPSLTAGTTSNNAGAFSPFTMTMSREDGQQNLKSIELHMPPGLLGTLTGIPLCGEAQADAGTCPAASLVGETTVSVGLGGSPFTVKGGEVFLTGPYGGAPFGLSIVNPAKAGPFDLGKIVVRAKLELNKTTAAVTVTSDSSGPYAIPPTIDGIPLEIKHVNVTINRAGGFTFNSTNCNPLAVTGTLQSIEGGSQALSVPFQATNCAALKFTPKFAVSTSGRTSRSKGASLTVKVTRPSGPSSGQANFAQVKVDLPKQLPSRLTTLQKACTNAQFEANPAGCPAASVVGHVKVLTPLLPVPVEGPAYFVSHGGEAFPSLIFVLQGYGVTIDVVSTTFISKAGITSATLKTVPDVPFTSFELTFPEGKYSALAANGNLCKTKLKMPTEFLAQNGAKINQSTPITVTGCKPTISVVRHSIKGKTATIAVSVPSAGKLVATGNGLSKASKNASKAGTVTVELSLSNGEQTFLAKHKGRKLKASVKLTFTPKKGSRLKSTTTVLIS